MNKAVYVVHAIDTEGPMYQSTQEVFKLLKEIFGISLEATKENLQKLYNKDDSVFSYIDSSVRGGAIIR